MTFAMVRDPLTGDEGGKRDLNTKDHILLLALITAV